MIHVCKWAYFWYCWISLVLEFQECTLVIELFYAVYGLIGNTLVGVVNRVLKWLDADFISDKNIYGII